MVNMSFKPDVPKNEQGNNLPDIYRLIRDGASSNDISQQMYSDYFTNRDGERVYLALRELKSRGPEGAAQIRMMSYGSDELSQKLKEIQDDNLEGLEIEGVLGIKRFGEIGGDYINDKTRGFDGLYGFLSRNGFKGSADDLTEMISRDIAVNSDGSAAQLSGEIEKCTFNIAFVFGSQEPDYLELCGPEEILRLRDNPAPEMLLLGSLGVYSARDFYAYAKKINENSNTTVLDINPRCVQMMRKDDKVKNRIVQGDARKMPIDSDVMDHVYTNHLFHYLYDDFDGRTRQEEILRILVESCRVLKKGGSLIVAETPFGEYKESEDYEKMLYEMRLLAKKAGFSDVVVKTSSLSYLIRASNMSAVVDENGFPHYENSLIERANKIMANCRFIK